ncbi:MAG: AEC family transporter [Phycisphaerae bacterium]|nr:AEC family transporter [Phycisphaerae bacterium]
MFLRLLLTVLGAFVMMLPGYIARRRGYITAEMVTGLARVHVGAIYPCLIFTTITRQFSLADLERAWVLPACSLGIMVLGWGIGLAAGTAMRLHPGPQKSAMQFQCTINNYSFLPLTLISGLFGSDYVAALLLSTLGAELALWTLGVHAIGGKGLGREHLRHLLSPPLLAMYAAGACLVGMHLGGISRSILAEPGSNVYVLHNSLYILGQGTIPLAMIIAGARLATLTWKDVHLPLTWATTALRLVAIPLAAVALLHVLPLTETVRQVMTVVAVMPVSVASMLFSELYGGDKDLINGTVLLSHLLALATIPLLLAWTL